MPSSQPATPSSSHEESVARKDAHSRAGLSRRVPTAAASRWKKRMRLNTGSAPIPRETAMNTSRLTTTITTAPPICIPTLPSRRPGDSATPSVINIAEAKMSKTFPATSVASALGSGTP